MRLSILFIGCLCFAAFQTAPAAEPGSVRETLDAIDKSIKQITSYDVIVRAESKTLVKVINPPTKPLELRKTRMEFRPLAEGEKPYEYTSLTRQIYSADGRCRYEKLTEDGKDWVHACVYTGKEARTFDRASNSGAIPDQNPNTRPFAQDEENYAALYRAVYGGDSLITLFEKRTKVNVGPDEAVPGRIILETGGEPGNNWYPSYAFKYTFDPARSMRFVQSEALDQRGLGMDKLWVVDELREIEPGNWMPIKATLRSGPKEQLRSITTVSVDVERSSWNQPLDDKPFTLPYPPGAKILDETRDLRLIVGEGDTGDDTEQLVKNAHSVRSAGFRRRRQEIMADFKAQQEAAAKEQSAK